MCAMCEPSGPMLKGTMYMVRPRMQPLKRPSRVARILFGSHQLLVGPASSSDCEQMKVRSSTRATSEGSDHARYELGRSFSLSLRNMPAFTSSAHSRSYSASDPSHQWMRSGCVSAAIPCTHLRSFWLRVGAPPATGAACACIRYSSDGAPDCRLGGVRRFGNVNYGKKRGPTPVSRMAENDVAPIFRLTENSRLVPGLVPSGDLVDGEGVRNAAQPGALCDGRHAHGAEQLRRLWLVHDGARREDRTRLAGGAVHPPPAPRGPLCLLHTGRRPGPRGGAGPRLPPRAGRARRQPPAG